MATTASLATRPSARPKATAPVKKAPPAIATSTAPATHAALTYKLVSIVKPANKALNVVENVIVDEGKSVIAARIPAMSTLHQTAKSAQAADIRAAQVAADRVKQANANAVSLCARTGSVQGEPVHAVEDVRYPTTLAVMQNGVLAHEAALAAKAEVDEVNVHSCTVIGSAAVQLALTQKLRA